MKAGKKYVEGLRLQVGSYGFPVSLHFINLS